jgi:hypothetical protein
VLLLALAGVATLVLPVLVLVLVLVPVLGLEPALALVPVLPPLVLTKRPPAPLARIVPEWVRRERGVATATDPLGVGVIAPGIGTALGVTVGKAGIAGTTPGALGVALAEVPVGAVVV